MTPDRLCILSQLTVVGESFFSAYSCKHRQGVHVHSVIVQLRSRVERYQNVVFVLRQKITELMTDEQMVDHVVQQIVLKSDEVSCRDANSSSVCSCQHNCCVRILVLDYSNMIWRQRDVTIGAGQKICHDDKCQKHREADQDPSVTAPALQWMTLSAVTKESTSSATMVMCAQVAANFH